MAPIAYASPILSLGMSRAGRDIHRGMEDVASRRTLGAGYQEHAVLADGTHAVLRPIRRTDGPLIQAMFPRLSPRTRYLRFHGPRLELSPEELRFFTEVDGESHFALGAIEPCTQELIGVGRFVRRGAAARQAEIAVVVADAQQGKGLGQLLLSRLREAALERDIAVFTGSILDENRPIRDLLRKLGARIGIGSWGVSDIEWSLS